MRGRCDVCGQVASYRVQISEHGGVHASELCSDHYEQLTDQRRALSPFDSLFGQTYAEKMTDRLRGTSSPRFESGGFGPMGGHESVDFDRVLTNDAKDILQKSGANNCDLIVMGGYSHARIYESILGGVTYNMLKHADRAVLMAH